MNRFRPQELGPMHHWREYKRLGFRDPISYHWQIRSPEWWPAGYKSNHKVIARQFRVLHYLSQHAPKPVRARWRKAAQAFEKKYFGVWNGHNVRFANKYTAHSWL